MLAEDKEVADKEGKVQMGNEEPEKPEKAGRRLRRPANSSPRPLAALSPLKQLNDACKHKIPGNILGQPTSRPADVPRLVP
jgi:hypothetical protein